MNVILKTAERCNINCDYCYFFRGSDQSYRGHAATIDRVTIEGVVKFLAQGVEELSLETLAIVFHGGEPMLQRKHDFDWMCTHMREAFSGRVRELQLGIQTNATLIDDEWIALFAEHSVAVGVSIDGPSQVHDRHRVDFAGRGTYDRTAAGIRKLQAASRRGDLPYSLGAIAVIDPSTSAREVFEHIVDVLGIRTIHWELPDLNNDQQSKIDASEFGRYLCDLFDAWTERDDPSIYVRVINSVLAKLTNQSSYLYCCGEDPDSLLLDVTEVTISSNGDIGVDDGLRQTEFWAGLPHHTICDTSLADYLHANHMEQLRRARTLPPHACFGCLWENLCGGGALVNRWSRSGHFDNPSVYCEGLKQFYSHLVTYLVRHGVPVRRVGDQLTRPERAKAA